MDKNPENPVRELWRNLDREIRNRRMELGDNRIQFHMHTLLIDCLRSTEPEETSDPEVVLERAQELLRNKKATKREYAELKRLLRDGGFSSLPEVSGE